ncbi:transposase [Vibrio parahaemolyticus]|nr:transposase [Vibrio parahaemolyticus]
MDGAGWHTEEIANNFKCQCHQTFALFSRAKPYRTSMALVAATLFSQPIFY